MILLYNIHYINIYKYFKNRSIFTTGCLSLCFIIYMCACVNKTDCVYMYTNMHVCLNFSLTPSLSVCMCQDCVCVFCTYMCMFVSELNPVGVASGFWLSASLDSSQQSRSIDRAARPSVPARLRVQICNKRRTLLGSLGKIEKNDELLEVEMSQRQKRRVLKRLILCMCVLETHYKRALYMYDIIHSGPGSLCSF